nr:E-beta-farnesene synthase [Tanacetum cinerariifolium]
MALHTQGKKKVNPIVILSIRFTKLIIHHLQSKHKFLSRPDSPLHFPYEEYILGYLKFSVKGTKREVFGMPIPNELITANIRGEQYYKDYLEKVAKHQRYLASEEGSDHDFPRPKPVKATKKSKPSAPKEKKRKLLTKTSDKPSPAKSSKPGLVTKRRKPTRSLSLVDEFVDEGIPEKEPRFDDEEANMQRVMEESLKSVHDAHWGLLPPVVFREPDSGKFQLLLERCTPVPTELLGHAESPLIYAKLGHSKPSGHTDSNTEFDEKVPHVVKLGAQDKGQAVPNPGVQIEGQVRSNPSDDAEPQPQSSLVVHDGPNLEHMDLEATDVLTQQNSEQMDKGFTATAYLNVQENLKLTIDEHVILEEPASSTGTLASLQHLAEDFSFGGLFFNDKPSKAENEKTTIETKAVSMVFVTIHQDTLAIPPMTSPVIDLISRPDSPDDHRPLPATTKATTTTTTKITTLPLPPQPQQGTTDSILIKRINELEQIMANLNQDNKQLEDRLNSNGSSLEKLINRDHTDELLTDLAEARRKKKKRHDSPKTSPGSLPHQLPPPPPLAGPSGMSGSSGSSQLPPLPPLLSTSQNLHRDDDTAPDEQVHSSDDEDIENAHIPRTTDMVIFMDWFCKKQGIIKLKPQDLKGPAFELVKVFHPNVIHLQYQMEECYKLVTDRVDESIIRYNVSKPLPLGGPPGHVTIQSDFFNKDLEYLRYGNKSGRPALSISKMKADYYLDFGLEKMVPDQIHTSKGDRKAVWSHMQILSVVRIEVLSMYSDDTLHQIDEALDYRVKEFKKRLKTRRIFRNLESFVGGRVREGDYRLLQ